MKQTVRTFENGEVVEKTIYGFCKETIEKLKDIGINATDNKGQYCDNKCSFIVYDNDPNLRFQLSNIFKSLEEMDKYYAKVRALAEKVTEITKAEYEEKEGK